MNRRNFIKKGSLTGISLSSLALASAATGGTNAGHPFEEATIDMLQEKMQRGEYTSNAITRIYLKRIAEIDKKGPALNAVIELNPDALAIADSMDAERRAGSCGGRCMGYRS